MKVRLKRFVQLWVDLFGRHLLLDHASAIAFELGLPVKLIGVGETLEDLRPFDAHDYARALVAG